jgi:hypothetical protein
MRYQRYSSISDPFSCLLVRATRAEQVSLLCQHGVCSTATYGGFIRPVALRALIQARQLSARLAAVGTLKRYSKKYRVKIAALGTLKRYSILYLTLYLEWYCVYSILYSDGPH